MTCAVDPNEGCNCDPINNKSCDGKILLSTEPCNPVSLHQEDNDKRNMKSGADHRRVQSMDVREEATSLKKDIQSVNIHGLSMQREAKATLSEPSSSKHHCDEAGAKRPMESLVSFHKIHALGCGSAGTSHSRPLPDSETSGESVPFLVSTCLPSYDDKMEKSNQTFPSLSSKLTPFDDSRNQPGQDLRPSTPYSSVFQVVSAFKSQREPPPDEDLRRGTLTGDAIIGTSVALTGTYGPTPKGTEPDLSAQCNTVTGTNCPVSHVNPMGGMENQKRKQLCYCFGERSRLSLIIASIPVIFVAAFICAALCPVLCTALSTLINAALTPSLTTRLPAITEIISRTLISDISDLRNFSTPQHKAALWLADEDEADIRLDDLERIVQRYALAVLYYSTGGGDGRWVDSHSFLSNLGECGWLLGSEHPIRCDSGGRVTAIDLTSNGLEGSIPSELAAFTNLKKLWLMNNSLSGQIPTEIALLQDLHSLNLAKNRLDGTIPEEVGNMIRLEEFAVWENNISGTIPDSLGRLTELTGLDLSSNYKLGGPIPRAIGDLVNLELLYLFKTGITGTIPTELGSLTKLNELALSRNKLRGSIPTQLGELTGLTLFYVFENELTGSLPSQLGKLTDLMYFNVRSNRLSGSIPSELDKLTKLRLLRVNNNAISGTISSEWDQFCELTMLDMSMNKLTGSIPPMMGKLNKLATLHLDGNQLSGNIPADFGALDNLKSIRLRDNLLSGTLPFSFTNLLSTVELYLDQNNMTGDVDFLCDTLKNLDNFWVDGEVVACTCCSCCQ